MTQNVVTNDEAVTGSNFFFLLFSLLLEGIYQISGVLLLKMEKKSKINPPYFIHSRFWYRYLGGVVSARLGDWLIRSQRVSLLNSRRIFNTLSQVPENVSRHVFLQLQLQFCMCCKQSHLAIELFTNS
jgi:hypothetical protein